MGLNTHNILSSVKKTLAAMALALAFSPAAHAITVSGVTSTFDNADDLLRLTGTVTSTNNGTFNEIGFDWDGPLNNFDFSNAQLLSSNVGGFISTPAGNLPAGLFAISGMVGGPFSAGFTFDFLIYIPGANGRFLNNNIDIFVCDDCTPGYVGGEVVNATTTPSRGDLTAPPPIPLPASALLLLSVLGSLTIWIRARPLSKRDTRNVRLA